MKNPKHIIRLYISIILLVVLTVNSNAQEENKQDNTKQEKPVKKDKPVRKTYEATQLIDNATLMNPAQGGLELIIRHRFGGISNGFSDLFGIYAASNIHLALQYGITKDLMISIGTEKNNKLQDLTLKYNLLTQTKKNTIPVSVTLLANTAISTLDEEAYGLDYSFSNRLSYFGQIIVTRKINKELSLQLAPSYAHYNAVDTQFQNDKIGIMCGGRYNITKKFGILAEYHHPIPVNAYWDTHTKTESGYSLGIQIATSTHAFQLFASTYEGIIPQHNYVKNINKLNSEGIAIGFNITVRF